MTSTPKPDHAFNVPKAFEDLSQLVISIEDVVAQSGLTDDERATLLDLLAQTKARVDDDFDEYLDALEEAAAGEEPTP